VAFLDFLSADIEEKRPTPREPQTEPSEEIDSEASAPGHAPTALFAIATGGELTPPPARASTQPAGQIAKPTPGPSDGQDPTTLQPASPAPITGPAAASDPSIAEPSQQKPSLPPGAAEPAADALAPETAPTAAAETAPTQARPAAANSNTQTDAQTQPFATAAQTPATSSAVGAISNPGAQDAQSKTAETATNADTPAQPDNQGNTQAITAAKQRQGTQAANTGPTKQAIKEVAAADASSSAAPLDKPGAQSADTISQAKPTAPAPAPAPTIAAEIIKRFEGKSTRFELRLDPPELGRVEIRLEVGRDQRVTALVMAENPQTLSELMRSARDLERSLSGSGLQLSDQGLQFDFGGTAQRDAERASQARQATGDVLAEEEAAPALTARSTRLFAGRIDLTV
jgi:flagellar hook-length control protein FliK